MKNNVPELTEEQRQEALVYANKQRKLYADIKHKLNFCEITLNDVLNMEEAGRLRLYDTLLCIPGIGAVRVGKILNELGVPRNKRLKALGVHQKEKILELVEGLNLC